MFERFRYLLLVFLAVPQFKNEIRIYDLPRGYRMRVDKNGNMFSTIAVVSFFGSIAVSTDNSLPDHPAIFFVTFRSSVGSLKCPMKKFTNGQPISKHFFMRENHLAAVMKCLWLTIAFFVHMIGVTKLQRARAYQGCQTFKREANRRAIIR